MTEILLFSSFKLQRNHFFLGCFVAYFSFIILALGHQGANPQWQCHKDAAVSTRWAPDKGVLLTTHTINQEKGNPHFQDQWEAAKCVLKTPSEIFSCWKKSIFFERTNNSFLLLKFSGLYLFIYSRNPHRYQLQAMVKGLENSYHSSCTWRWGKNMSSTAGAKGLWLTPHSVAEPCSPMH